VQQVNEALGPLRRKLTGERLRVTQRNDNTGGSWLSAALPRPLKGLITGLVTGLAERLRRRVAPAGGPVWRGGAGDIILSLDPDGLILDISPAAADMIGAEGPLKGRSLFDFVRREDRETVRRALEGAPGAASFTDFRLLRARRAPALCEISFAPESGRGRRTAALIRARGEELARLRKARAAEEEARRAAAIRDDLMADLGHELKTPLNAIMGFAEAMREETFGPLGDDKYREYADHIHGSGAHLMELISAVLDAAKLEAGRYELAPAPVAPGALARECAEMVRGEAETAGLDLVVSVSPDLPEAMLDKRAVKQILINLLSNAVKFTAAGGVSLSVTQKGGVLDFTVRDTGIGMSEDALAQLGRRFTEAHQNGVRGTKGAGLGLALAMSLAELHGGAVSLASTPGEGTVARLSLPLGDALADPAPAAKPAPAGDDRAPARIELAADDIQSQLDRVAAYRRERAAKASAA